jgi:formate dehydrogenase subunit beta
MSEEIQAGIQIRARELLSLGEVGCVIGHERSPRGCTRPAFIYEAAEADRLVWDQTCHHNLVVYLRDKAQSPATTRRSEVPPRVAVVARPCDVRALNVLIHEGQVIREQVFVIGVACPGMLETRTPLPPCGEEAGVLTSHCQRCKERVPVFYDALVGQPPKGKAEDETWADVAEVEAMTPAERLAFWTREFERCIRCYACRQACPGCYCFECLAEQVDPPWVSIAHRVPEKAFFHIMRAYHLAGRCVECHACDLACPMHIPLSLLNRKIAREVQALFGYIAGGDPEIPPPLATFRKDEDLPL